MREDFLLNENGSFPLQDTIQNGVILPTPYGSSDQQHIVDIIFCKKGDVKSSPIDGFGIFDYLNSETSISTVENNLDSMLNRDGYGSNNGVVQPSSDGNPFTIDDSYIYIK